MMISKNDQQLSGSEARMSARSAVAPGPAANEAIRVETGADRRALASLALAMLLPSLGTSIANVALPTLAVELGASGIRVNSTFMGWMWGPPVEGYVEMAAASGRAREEVIAEITADIPLGIIPDDADCANAVAFLASDLASVITGAELDVNGGEMMV